MNREKPYFRRRRFFVSYLDIVLGLVGCLGNFDVNLAPLFDQGEYFLTVDEHALGLLCHLPTEKHQHILMQGQFWRAI